METKRIRVAVLMGGPSTEHEVSLSSGANVCNSLPRERFLIKPVVITREFGWRLYPGWLEDEAEYKGMPPDVESADAGAALSRFRAEGIEVVFIALHGPGGEDGVIQGFFETAGFPYTGSGVLGNAVGMDKILTKQILLQVGIPTAPYMAAESREVLSDPDGFADRVEKSFGYPSVVKVGNQGSSRNLGIAFDRTELLTLLDEIARAGEFVIVEEYIDGRELTCAVINKPGSVEPFPLPPTERVPLTSKFFDYHAKFTPGATDEITPARITEAETAKVQEIAVRTHRALRCSGMSRTDMIKRGEELFVLEINTIPGLTNTSLLPQAAAAMGISFPELLEIQILRALEKQK